MAVDLGTTKIAGYLVNMETGETLQAKGVMNPQISYGEDVMARITVALEGAEQADTLRNAVVAGIADLTKEMCAEAGVGTDQIVDAVIVGNTAMHHLFLGLPVEQLGRSPYVAAVSEALDVKARDIGFPFCAGRLRTFAAEHCRLCGVRIMWLCCWRQALAICQRVRSGSVWTLAPTPRSVWLPTGGC